MVSVWNYPLTVPDTTTNSSLPLFAFPVMATGNASLAGPSVLLPLGSLDLLNSLHLFFLCQRHTMAPQHSAAVSSSTPSPSNTSPSAQDSPTLIPVFTRIVQHPERAIHNWSRALARLDDHIQIPPSLSDARTLAHHFCDAAPDRFFASLVCSLMLTTNLDGYPLYRRAMEETLACGHWIRLSMAPESMRSSWPRHDRTTTLAQTLHIPLSSPRLPAESSSSDEPDESPAVETDTTDAMESEASEADEASAVPTAAPARLAAGTTTSRSWGKLIALGALLIRMPGRVPGLTTLALACRFALARSLRTTIYALTLTFHTLFLSLVVPFALFAFIANRIRSATIFTSLLTLLTFVPLPLPDPPHAHLPFAIKPLGSVVDSILANANGTIHTAYLKHHLHSTVHLLQEIRSITKTADLPRGDDIRLGNQALLNQTAFLADKIHEYERLSHTLSSSFRFDLQHIHWNVESLVIDPGQIGPWAAVARWFSAIYQQCRKKLRLLDTEVNRNTHDALARLESTNAHLLHPQIPRQAALQQITVPLQHLLDRASEGLLNLTHHVTWIRDTNRDCQVLRDEASDWIRASQKQVGEDTLHAQARFHSAVEDWNNRNLVKRVWHWSMSTGPPRRDMVGDALRQIQEGHLEQIDDAYDFVGQFFGNMSQRIEQAKEYVEDARQELRDLAGWAEKKFCLQDHSRSLFSRGKSTPDQPTRHAIPCQSDAEYAHWLLTFFTEWQKVLGPWLLRLDLMRTQDLESRTQVDRLSHAIIADCFDEVRLAYRYARPYSQQKDMARLSCLLRRWEGAAMEHGMRGATASAHDAVED